MIQNTLLRSLFAALILSAALFAACHRKVPTGPSDPPPPPPVVSDYHYHRKLYSGPFFATDATRYGLALTPGNVEVVADGSDASRRLDPSRMVIASPDDRLGLGRLSVDTVEPGKLLAVFVGIGGNGEYDPTAMAAGRLAADTRGVPLLVYSDSAGFTDVARSFLKPGDWAGINAYPDGAQSPAQIIDRVQATINTFHSNQQIAIIRPMYQSTAAWNLQTIFDLQIPLTDMISRNPNIVADLWFAWLRPSGVVTHPEFIPIAQQLATAAVSGE